MTRRTRIGTILAAAAVSLPLAACGDDDVGDPIPNGRAAELEALLDQVRDNVDQDLCDEAAADAARARTTVDELDDDGVGSDVQDALGDGVDNLMSLVRVECEEEVETIPETTPEPTLPEPTITETTPEPTITETTPEPTTPVPEPEPEPDEGDGGAQFDPNAEIPPGQQKKEDD
jgi:hypothetical protein